MSDTKRAQSRLEWSGESTVESINCGSLQRIADASEAMASNWNRLVFDLKHANGTVAALRADAVRRENCIRALRGALTKAKKARGEA